MTAARHHLVLRQIPNVLTIGRLAAVPVFIWLMMREEGRSSAAAWVFAAAAVTDFFDGVIARRAGLMSQFGKVVDPLADRLLIGSAAILLSVYDPRLPWWAFVIVLWRDALAVFGFAMVRRRLLVDVSWSGKAATLLMMGGLGSLLFWTGDWPLWLFWGGFALSVIALIEYTVRYSWAIPGRSRHAAAAGQNMAANPPSEPESSGIYSPSDAPAAQAPDTAGTDRDREESSGAASRSQSD